MSPVGVFVPPPHAFRWLHSISHARNPSLLVAATSQLFPHCVHTDLSSFCSEQHPASTTEDSLTP